MSAYRTAADTDPNLANLLGRFAQASANLERSLEAAVIRMLPVTDRMGLVIVGQNSGMANLTVLTRLADLPEVPLSDERRQAIRDMYPAIKALIEDRNRILHNPIVAGDDGYFLIQNRPDPNKVAAMPISAVDITERIEASQSLAYKLMTYPALTYDFSTWGRAWPSYPKKPYPKSRD